VAVQDCVVNRADRAGSIGKRIDMYAEPRNTFLPTIGQRGCDNEISNYELVDAYSALVPGKQTCKPSR
jgi:hypothetical protein